MGMCNRATCLIVRIRSLRVVCSCIQISNYFSDAANMSFLVASRLTYRLRVLDYTGVLYQTKIICLKPFCASKLDFVFNYLNHIGYSSFRRIFKKGQNLPLRNILPGKILDWLVDRFRLLVVMQISQAKNFDNLV